MDLKQSFSASSAIAGLVQKYTLYAKALSVQVCDSEYLTGQW
ncbi:MAG: hypothetical protein RMY00_30925 [Nostoc sp. ChiVER01]|nr:hypothetical protein [Nostoc sp. ChiVER01]